MSMELTTTVIHELMAETLKQIDIGAIIINKDDKILFVNDSFKSLLNLNNYDAQLGGTYGSIILSLEKNGEFGRFRAMGLQKRWFSDQYRGESACWVHHRPQGQILAVQRIPHPSGADILTVADITNEYRAAARIKAANKSTVLSMANMAESRDRTTGDHVIRVARLAHELTRTLKQAGQFQAEITADLLEHIGTASILHDVGKVSISDGILHKPGPLTDSERRQMQTHCQIGRDLLRRTAPLSPNSPYITLGLQIAQSHHEYYDGHGYPDGLAGNAIPLAARIVAVADVYDALTNERPYKSAWSQTQTLAYMNDQSGRQFDPLVVAALMQVMAERAQCQTIQWTAEMSVGQEDLDRDHHTLIALINHLSLGSNHNDRIMVELVLDELVDYTIRHFDREEAYLAQRNFPQLDHHRDIHRRMIQDLQCLQADFMDGLHQNGSQLMEFLGTWLRQHIMQEDMRYTRPA